MTRKKRISNKPDNRVHIRSIWNENKSVNPSSTATNLGELTTSNSGLWALNNQVSSLSDMFRLFKINGVIFELIPQYTTAGTAVNVPAGLLMLSLNGQSNPTTFSDAETPLQSNLSLPWGATTTGNAEAIVRESIARLTLANKDLVVNQGPSSPGDAGYLVTQDDGTQTSYGRLFWLLASAATSTTLNYVLRSYFDLDFKDILDPSTISSIQAERAARAVSFHCEVQAQGVGAHITFSPGTLEKAIQLHMRVNRGVPLRAVEASSPQTLAPDADRQDPLPTMRDLLDALNAMYPKASKSGSGLTE